VMAPIKKPERTAVAGSDLPEELFVGFQVRHVRGNLARTL